MSPFSWLGRNLSSRNWGGLWACVAVLGVTFFGTCLAGAGSGLRLDLGLCGWVWLRPLLEFGLSDRVTCWARLWRGAISI